MKTKIKDIILYIVYPFKLLLNLLNMVRSFIWKVLEYFWIDKVLNFLKTYKIHILWILNALLILLIMWDINNINLNEIIIRSDFLNVIQNVLDLNLKQIYWLNVIKLTILIEVILLIGYGMYKVNKALFSMYLIYVGKMQYLIYTKFIVLKENITILFGIGVGYAISEDTKLKMLKEHWKSKLGGEIDGETSKRLLESIKEVHDVKEINKFLEESISKIEEMYKQVQLDEQKWILETIRYDAQNKTNVVSYYDSIMSYMTAQNVMIGSVIILIGIGVYYIYINEKSKKEREPLEEQIREMRRAINHLEEAQIIKSREIKVRIEDKELAFRVYLNKELSRSSDALKQVLKSTEEVKESIKAINKFNEESSKQLHKTGEVALATVKELKVLKKDVNSLNASFLELSHLVAASSL